MKKRGFTLIELLVVVAIIGLLSSIVLVSIKTAREDAAEKKSMQFSASIYHSLGAYALGIWHFDGDYNDSSGNDIETEWIEPGDFVDGIINQAVNLYEAGDIMYVASTEKMENKSGQATMEFWVKVNSSNYGQLINSENLSYNNAPFECIIHATEKIRCYMEDIDGTYISFLQDFQLTKWFHVVLTYSGEGSAQMFFNGEELIPNAGGAFSAEFYTEAEIYVGNWDGGLDAYMDELRIYDSYISLSEAKKHYAQGLMRIGLAEYNNHSL